MDFKDYGDLYKPRSKPVLPIAALIVAAIVIVLFVIGRSCSGCTKTDNSEEPESSDTAKEIENKTKPVVQTPAPVIAAEKNAIAYPEQELAQIVADAASLRKSEKLIEARDLLRKVVSDGRALGKYRNSIEKSLGEINIELLTSYRPMPGKVDYIIKPGDLLVKLASDYNCPAALIQKINNITNPDRIRPGDVIRIMDHPVFAIEINKSDNTLLLTQDGKFFKRYLVGTGTYGKTPVGTFVISEKQVNPDWWRPDGKVVVFGDKENILGTRWMRITATGETPPVQGYGIHGTWDNSSIGKQSSAGCIRMVNSDVEELWMLIQRNAPVVIKE